MSILSHDALLKMGFATIGENVKISNHASIHNPTNIHIGDDVRIDDFCVLSAGAGGIFIGDHVHIAVYSSLIGAGRISLSNFCNLSSRVSVYSSNDDYSGETMTNPTVPEQYKNVTNDDVYIGKHVIIGSGSVVLPGAKLEEGVAIGALSLVNKNCSKFGIYSGNPIKWLKKRSHTLIELEKSFLHSKKTLDSEA